MPLPLSVAAQLLVQADGNVPAVVESVTLEPPVVRLLPAASLACTVIVVVLDPSAVIEDGLPLIVEVAVEIGPGVTEKVDVAEVRPALEAVIVTEPAMLPVTVRDAMPEEAVALPSPVTEPAPAVWAKLTTVVLSPVSTLPPASSTAAVSPFVEPEATLAAPDVNASLAAAPRVMLKVFESAAVRLPSVACSV